MNVKKIEFETGYVILIDDYDRRSKYPISSFIDVYTDAKAKAASVLAGNITDSETRAPTHDAVYNVKVTADAATTPAEATAAAKAVKLDDFTAPDDGTDLDATASLHGLMPKADKGKLDDAASAATASKLVIRDGSSRAKFAAPGASGDALIKGTRVTTAELPAMTDEKIWKGTGASVEEVDVYTDAAAVSAMSAKADDNPLNHDRYTNALAVTAAKTVKLDDLTASEDNTDLDASAAKHGLYPKADFSKLAALPAVGLAHQFTDVTLPANTVSYVGRDNTGDLTIHTITGKAINLAIVGADVLRVEGAKISLLQDIFTDRWDGASANVYIGVDVCGGDAVSGASGNVVIGYQAAYDLTSGDRNVVIGAQCYPNMTGPEEVVVIGYDAFMVATTASKCVAIGHEAGKAVTTADGNVFVGRQAGYFITSGADNICIGNMSGIDSGFTTQKSCIFIGERTYPTMTVYDGTIMIGRYGTYAALLSDNQGDWEIRALSGKKIDLKIGSTDELTVTGSAVTIPTNTFTVGSSGVGADVTFHGDTAGDSIVWSAASKTLDITYTAGNTADDVVKISPTWGETRSSGYAKGLLVAGAIAGGTLTGSAEVDGIGIEFTSITAACPFLYGLNLYTANINDIAVGTMIPIGMYIEDIGNSVGNFVGVDIGRVIENTASARDTFMRFKSHSATTRGKSIFYLEGSNSKLAGQLIMFGGAGEGNDDWIDTVHDLSSGHTQVGVLKVGKEAVIGGGVTTQFYIPLYTAD